MRSHPLASTGSFPVTLMETGETPDITHGHFSSVPGI